MKKLKHLNNEVKVLRDPVHEYIHVSDEIIWNLIDAKEFQRLRRIRQLGGTYQVYHGAEHSRFSHSLGVYEIARRMIEEVEGLKDALSEKEQIAVKCAALLHDVGHGPFSHAFESVTNVNHELMSVRIILQDTEINQILRQYDEEYPQMVADIISHTHTNKLLTQIMSAQLDADRMDYLLRDSYFTGVSYGEFDLERILRTLRIKNNSLVIKESGIHALEDYIMARYQMYWQVYYHPVSRSFEILLKNMFKKIKDVYEKDPTFIQERTPYFVGFVDNQAVSVDDHLYLDEQTCFHGFKEFMIQDKYPGLSDLARRIIDRDLFQEIDFDEATYTRLCQQLKDKGYDPQYYLGYDEPKQRPYVPYKLENTDGLIWVLLRDGSVKEISHVSSIVNAMADAKLKEDKKIFYVED